MPKKPDDGRTRVSGIKAPRLPNAVERLGGVSEVEKTQKAAGVAPVRGLGGPSKTRPTRIMSAAEREALHQMIHEEADRLFGKGKMSGKQREVVETAVKMAVDAAIVEEEGDPKDDDKKDKGTPRK